MAAKIDPRVLEKLRRLLCALQAHICAEVIAARRVHAKTFARVAAVTEADTIYRIDKISEAAILWWFEQNWPTTLPVELVMEGIEAENAVTFPRGTPVEKTAWKCILDPIDGTRCIMYDKRSAWSLGAIAPQRGSRTGLADIVVAAMTELPTTKQIRSDQFSAWRGGKLMAIAKNTETGAVKKLQPAPSRARGFGHGFSSFVRFFPEGRTLVSQIEETVWEALRDGAALPIFDDQYLSTGGQIHELLTGRDRVVVDIRPLVLARLGKAGASLSCHPYDLCTALLLEVAGGLVESPLGGPVRAPLDTTSPVAWVGYANPHLAKRFRPVLRKALRRHLGSRL